MTRNWITAGVALLAAVVVFAAHTFFVSATRPRQVDVLAAARDLRPGEALKDADLTVVQVYEDARVDAYFPPSERERLVGAYVLLPFVEGQPLTRSGVLASGGSRTLALLADDPDLVLFPIPLDAGNVIAGEPASYLPGDYVGLAVVFESRPREPERPEPTPGPALPSLPPFAATPTPTPQVAATPTPTPTPQPFLAYEARGVPPVVRVLDRPARVILVTGLPSSPQDEEGTAGLLSTVGQERPFLWVLVPRDDVELLSLALSAGEIHVFLMHPDAASRPGGYSYWDFEAALRKEREAQVGEATPPSPTPPASATSTPAGVETPLATATPTPTLTP